MENESGVAKTDFTQVPAGHFDQIEISRDQIRIAGWILSPEEPLVRLEVLVNGGLLGEATPQERADVAKVHRWISHAEKSGFSFHQTDPARQDSDLNEVEVRGVGQTGRIVSMIGLDNHGSGYTHPLPPESLFRLVGSPDAASYTSQGLKIFSDITSAIRRYDDLDRFTRVLDWGCGCGRLLTHLIPAFPDKDFSGCDLVPEAIDWCRTQFPEGSFEYAKTHPPLPFDNHSFDLVIASSVFTHLDRNLQQLWLDELARVLEPGGLLVASVLGPYAYLRDSCSRWSGGYRFRVYLAGRRLESRGILDQFKNNSLRRLVGTDYYRNTYQEPHYTLRRWSKHFRIRAYIERGLDNYQDLLVMQRES